MSLAGASGYILEAGRKGGIVEIGRIKVAGSGLFWRDCGMSPLRQTTYIAYMHLVHIYYGCTMFNF